jgi:hypothetical protein
MLPRVTVRTIDTPPAIPSAAVTTKAIIVGETELGILQPTAITKMDRWRDYLLGSRTGAAIPTYNAVDIALREGYPLVYVTRAVGPDATTASAAVAGGSGTSLTLRATGPGEYANGATGGLKYEIVNGPGGGTEREVVIYRGGTTAEFEVERSPVFTAATKATVLTAWGDAANPDRTAKWVVVELGADTGLPTVAGPTNLTGGDADLAGITSTEIREALDRVPKGLGPAQVFAPWRTAASTHQEVLEHCSERNRIALLDGVQGSSVSTLVALAAASRALGSGAQELPRLGGLWGQYAIGPGVTPGTTRTVPASIVVGGMLCRATAKAGHANAQPVGESGVPVWAERMDRYFDEAPDGDADTLTDGGVNVFVQRGPEATPRNYTFDSLDDPESSEWDDLAHSNYVTGVVARAEEIGEQMRDGSQTIQQAIPRFGSLLRLMLEGDFTAGALHGGGTLGDPFRVNVETANDAETMADGELNADLGLRTGEHVRDVNINVAKTPTNQPV